jgi:hypothetical protein
MPAPDSSKSKTTVSDLELQDDGLSTIPAERSDDSKPVAAGDARQRPLETGGPMGLDPTRYGDWERGGRCIDF